AAEREGAGAAALDLVDLGLPAHRSAMARRLAHPGRATPPAAGVDAGGARRLYRRDRSRRLLGAPAPSRLTPPAARRRRARRPAPTSRDRRPRPPRTGARRAAAGR